MEMEYLESKALVGSQGLINAIHGRDDGGDVWCTIAREKKGSVLENL